MTFVPLDPRATSDAKTHPRRNASEIDLFVDPDQVSPVTDLRESLSTSFLAGRLGREYKFLFTRLEPAFSSVMHGKGF